LQPYQVNTSSTPYYLDSTTGTKFVFNAPVYIQPGVLYAFIVKSTSTDYTLYYGQQNQIAIPSTNNGVSSKIGAAPYVGALFESQNSITWTADQTKDLMFIIDRCVFSTTPASVPFVLPQNLPHRKLGASDVKYKLDPNSVSGLLGNYSQSVRMDALNVTTTDFVPSSASINYSYSAILQNGLVSTSSTPINPGKLGSPTPENVLLNDGQGSRALITSLSNSFTLTAVMATTDSSVTPIISDDGVSLYAVRNMINNMGIGNNVISITNSGLGYNVATANIRISSPDIGSNTAVLGFTANSNGAITSVYTISSGSGYLTTPTITISDPATRSGNANVSVVVYGETSQTGGNSYAKYFTKKVVLVPGNDSGDLRVYLDAYQPLGTGLYVYYKILNSRDNSAFESGSWQLMTCVNNYNNYSTSRSNLIEYEFAPGVFSTNQANNLISYTNTSGQTFNSFIQFAIKVVLTTNDKTNIPFISGLRAIALPSGTGL
jgi:hypothetical protein